MMQTPYPLERDLGMWYYASNGKGIGGKLRTAPEDFQVKELPLPSHGGSAGPYLVCLLTKRNWELQHAVKEIAKRLGISHRRIGWAGTKDRNAVTKQFITLFNVTPEQVGELKLKDITLKSVGNSNAQLSLGDLSGNRFGIAIRDCSPDQLAERVESATAAIRNAIPNYFGIQRFGSIRPVTHRVGEWILKGDYEQAVMTYIGMVFPGEPVEIRSIRSGFLATKDAGEALHRLPSRMGYERSMLQHLHIHPGDYAGALQQMPPKLLSMFVSAVQSHIFNLALSRRMEEGHGLAEPVAGDTLLFANGRTDTVNQANIAAARIHIGRGRCSIALLMPGKETGGAALDSPCAAIMGERGITPAQFESASTFVRTAFDGAYRPIALKASPEVSIEETTVRLNFTLPPGHYATSVCREYMKADPIMMV
jgi:tRNA pseudouridine13 synthase